MIVRIEGEMMHTKEYRFTFEILRRRLPKADWQFYPFVSSSHTLTFAPGFLELEKSNL